MHNVQPDSETILAALEGRLDAYAMETLTAQLAASGESLQDYAWLPLATRDMARMGNAFSSQFQCPDIASSLMDLLASESAPVDLDPVGVSLTADLASMGLAHASKLPDIDIRDTLLAEINGIQKASTVPFNRHESTSHRYATRWALNTMAIAAVLLMAIGLYLVFKPTANTSNSIPVQIATQDKQHSIDPAATKDAAKQYDALRAQIPGPDASSEPFMEAVEAPSLDSLMPEDILSAHKEARTNASVLKKLAAWASLTPEKARSIANAPGASLPVVAGAARFLPADERQAVLATVSGYHTDGNAANIEPGVRLLLTQAACEQKSSVSDASLTWLADADPANAISYYMRAKLLLDEGDITGALEWLRAARELDSASSYALQTAQYQVAALIAGGMDPEAAQLAVALAPTSSDYDFLQALGSDLASHAYSLLSDGNTTAAEEILLAVQRMGEQLAVGATMTSEQLAALDIEKTAIEMLEELYTAINSLTQLDALTVQTYELYVDLLGLNSFMGAIEDLVNTTTDLSFWASFAENILQNGNVALMNLWLSSGGASLEQLLATGLSSS